MAMGQTERWIPTMDLEHKQIIRSSDVVFNESVMHKMAERPIEVQRVAFSKVSAFHDGPTHNLRSASQVDDSSCTESVPTYLTQPNVSAPDHPT